MLTKRRLLSAAASSALGLALATGGVPARAAGPKRVVLLVSGTLGDKSFFDSANHGMQLIKQKYGERVQTRVIEMGYDQSKWQPTFEDIAGQDWDMIICGTYQLPDILAPVAADNPRRTFVIFDSSMDYSKGANKNVYSITYKQNEASYLAGVMAEGMIRTGAIPAAERHRARLPRRHRHPGHQRLPDRLRRRRAVGRSGGEGRGVLYRQLLRRGEGQGTGAGAVPLRRRHRLQRGRAGRAGAARGGEGHGSAARSASIPTRRRSSARPIRRPPTRW